MEFQNNHFTFGYAGNKRKETPELYKMFKHMTEGKDIKYIVEPFCGSSSFAYYVSINEPNKYVYILNDNNPHLISFYRVMQSKSKLLKLIKKLNLMTINLNKEKYKEIIQQDTMEGWIISHKILAIRPGFFPLNYHDKMHRFDYMLDCPIVSFLRNEKIILFNGDGISIIKTYNRPDKFIFLDPPYLTMNNDFYYDHNTNVYEYLAKHKITTMKAQVMLCLSDNWIVRLLFSDDIKKTYEKKYEVSKNTVTHLIITN